MEYQFSTIEKKWKEIWNDTKLYQISEDFTKQKYYILDMFPYPSGSGLHVGHPLGFVASDIFARYKRLNGFNVLHPMGFDAFGLPAEQYAIETGQHPAVTTEKNIRYYREQLDKIGFNYDWDREVKTNDPKFYKWTQWIFMQLFKCWYNPFKNRAEYIDTLIQILEKEGCSKLFQLDKCDKNISSEEWRNLTEEQKQKFLMQFRLAYLDYAEVWWCEILGTVLANDEVKDGVSERGGHLVEKIKMRQWFLRITEYTDRLLEGLIHLDWSDSMKEMQRNWIGKSEGATVRFKCASNPLEQYQIEVFTTRPDTIYGATFIVLAPEHELVSILTSEANKKEVEQYISYVKSRSERDRISEVKKVNGQFIGAYAINPFTEEEIPIYIAEYVLAGYGTGAIMAVPSNDERDFAFATKFNIPIIEVVDQSEFPNASREDKVGKIINSEIINGYSVLDAIQKIITEIENKKIGKGKKNYRFRDAGFSRQRYWGEPFPVFYKNELPYLLEEKDLPVVLPEVESYKPKGAGKSPLASLQDWMQYTSQDGQDVGSRESDTMPGYAGSSWYFYRYMDVNNEDEFASKERINYWKNVDLYIGGSEHAVGHLLYSRMWNKFLFDLGLVPEDEPFKKLVNQGMIQGFSKFAYKILWSTMSGWGDIISPTVFISKKIIDELQDDPEDNFGGKTSSKLKPILENIINSANPDLNISLMTIRFSKLNLDIRHVNSLILDKTHFRNWREEYKNAIFINDDYSLDENEIYSCGFDIEKMSKSKHNVINPDEVISEYGADCFRMYEMFLGPLDASKPWDTKGITGVQGFLRKLWRLFIDEQGNLKVMSKSANPDELKILHKAIKKVTDDIEKLSCNTAVSAFMICVNELTTIKCTNKNILEELLILIAPFAPFIAEELWEKLGNSESVHKATWPKFDERYLIENNFNYPVSVNGKMRATIELPLDMTNEEIEKTVLSLESVIKWMEGKQPKKIIIVKGKIVNVVV